MRRVLAGVVLLLAACPSAEPDDPPRIQPYAPDGRACRFADDPALPYGAGCASRIRADLDGDGRPDRFVVYAVAPRTGVTSWSARGLIGDAATNDEPVSCCEFPARARPVGAADADGDGGDEVFVQIHRGAAAVTLEIFTYRNARLTRVRWADVPALRGASGGRPFHVIAAGSRAGGGGASCERAADGTERFVVTGVGVLPNRRFTWRENRYRWRGASLAPAGTRQGTMREDDPRLGAFYQVRCGGLVLDL